MMQVWLAARQIRLARICPFKTIPFCLFPWRLALKFRFPIVIIDEDYRTENTSGFGICAFAEAIKE